MKNQKGFTLLELLIAATIIGTLAVLATVSYRASESDAHVAAARAKVEVLAGAVQRFRLEYEHANIASGKIGNLSLVPPCDRDVRGNPDNNPSVLIQCDFVDNGGWDNPYFDFYVCALNGDETDRCPNPGGAPEDRPLACMKGKDGSRLTDQYQEGYWFCVSATGTREHFSS